MDTARNSELAQVLSILVVDDDEVDRMAVRRTLQQGAVAVQIEEAETSAQAIAALQRRSFDCVFLDYRLPDQDGLALIQTIRAEGIQSPLIVLTGQGDEQIAVDLMKAGASDYLTKSKITPGRLMQMLRNALRVYQAEAATALANQKLRESHDLLVKQNQALEEQQRQIEQQNLQQQDFIAHLTHDLRTPLIAADNMLKLFAKEAFCPLSADMHTAIAAMICSNYHLMQIVDTLLEVQRYEAGAKKLTFMQSNLLDIAQDVVETLQPLAQSKRLNLTITPTIDPNCAPIVLGDHLELRRMLTNLIDNAIKFTETGTIDVNVTTLSQKEQVMITVSDTGPGIASQELHQLFERFRKGTQRQAGSGLVLHLVHRIVQIHQGAIAIESEPGRGSTFKVCFPIQALSANRD